MTSHLPTRRGLLLGLAAAATLGPASLALAAGAGDRRFVVVILRGALDGLAAVQPYGDPRCAELRGELALPEPGQEGGLRDLGGHFGLHPAMAQMHAMYAANELAILHAVAGPYRTRSHFEGQDLLESGSDRRLTSGWLNRAVQGMADAGDARAALAVGIEVPLLLRGPAHVGAYAPPAFTAPQPDLYARLAALTQPDPVIGPAMAEGLRARGFSAAVLNGEAAPPDRRNAFAVLARAAGRLLAAPEGPRIAALELNGWDTHAYQAQRLAAPLRMLDEGLGALRDALGPAWARTAVLVMTEFGRTVRVNGTRGTDHGTGGVAFVAGGAIAGGRIAGDWPGLRDLHQDRDLMPANDLRAVALALLRDHLRLPTAARTRAFPGASVDPIPRLIRA